MNEQLVFQAILTGLTEDEAKEQTRAQLAPLRALLDDESSNTPFLNVSSTYWRDLLRYNPLTVTAEIEQPVLLL